MAYGGAGGSHGEVIRPFGKQPNRLAGRYGSQYAKPLEFGFGFGNPDNKRVAAFEADLAGAKGPLADFIRSGRSYMASDPLAAASRTGADIASRAPATFDLINDEVANFLAGTKAAGSKYAKSNVGNEALTRGVVGSAKGQAKTAADFTKEAMSPLRDRALYREASRRLLDSTRGDAAARGVLQSGSQQAREDELGMDLSMGFADRAFSDQLKAQENERLATRGVSDAILGSDDMARRGLDASLETGKAQVDAAGRPIEALQKYGDIQAGALALPEKMRDSLMSFFNTANNPTLALLSQTLPKIFGESKSSQAGVSFTGGGDQGV